MAELNAALIAFAGVLVGGYFNNFLAEDFRRFRDSQAIAGALAGELESHGEAIPYIKAGLQKIQEAVKAGNGISMPEWPVPNSPVFEANVEKVGLLQPDLAKGVAYVYEQVRAFRSALHQLSKHHEGRDADWQISAINGCLFAITNAEKKGALLIESLKRHAAASYWKRPATIKQCVIGLLLVAVLVVATIRYSGTSERDAQCTTTLDHGALHTVCK
ncbi:hypothetical protein AB9X41_17515 [Ralstonia solanacearum]|uniref:hypothetical protein n=1 Tax=Ralstonia solanacearum TaxID=305 RepID=UPI001FF77C2C